jgi:predicted nucleic acid-binding protein
LIRAFIDTNVVLDLLLTRQEFVDPAAEIWDANSQGKFKGYISAVTPVNVFYIARKVKGIDFAFDAVKQLLDNWQIAGLDRSILLAAYASSFSDYEDAVQNASADAERLDYIVTRNIDHFRRTTITVLTPVDFLKQLNLP